MARYTARGPRALVVIMAVAARVTAAVGGDPPPPVATPAPVPAAAAGGGVEAGLARLDPLIRDVIARGGIPGIEVAVVRDGRVAWSGAYGIADAGSLRPVTADTVFEGAGLGEPVFAYAVMRLAERGEFDLDRPLSVVLPISDLRNDPRSRAITARLVLSHASGLANWRRDGRVEITSDPGERFSYSREGYGYLQRVIEAVTSLTVDEFVRREVFAPLGMAASSYRWREDYAATAAVGHDYLQLPVASESPAAAHVSTTLRTTASEYARFLAEVMRPTLLKPATVARMLKPAIEVEKAIAWALGWGVERAGDRTSFWDWGETAGSRSFAIGCTQTGEALVVLTNGENGLAAAEPIVRQAIGGAHPLFSWLDFDPYDSPARTIRERVVRAGVANGERGVLRTLDELERAYPRAAFSERLLNRIGYELLGKKKAGAAVAVFERNVKLYPESWNVYDSLGEAYAADGDVRLAVQNYQKSLKLNPDNANAKAALRELRDAPRPGAAASRREATGGGRSPTRKRSPAPAMRRGGTAEARSGPELPGPWIGATAATSCCRRRCSARAGPR